MGSYAEQLKSLDLASRKIQAKQLRTIEKAMKSDSPSDIIAGGSAYQKIEKKSSSDNKAFLIDPLQFNASLGYKGKPYSLSYATLRAMAATPIINSIIKTRKNQVADFAEPQADRYNTGFVIRKKISDSGYEMTKREQKVANSITDFILNCGGKNSWTNDDFDTFIRKIVDDSYTYDQMTFECVRNRRGQLESFLATDASTFRIADSAFKEDYKNPFFSRKGANIWANQDLTVDLSKEINGYTPQYVQVYQGAVVNEFYPWELCFGIRNPSTSIINNGYGCSELEQLINVVTSLLWSDEYNRRFFSQGSAPKGMLKIKGNVSEKALQQFKQQWQAMITGVMQSWKTPVVDADVDWVDLQKTNRDMEFSNWQEYLIKIACAIYSIDPSEIGWDISRGANGSGLFEGNQAEKLQNSKDKGLYPILKFIQRKINKYIVEAIDPDYEFVFMGLNGMTIDKELEMDVKRLSSFMTINEVRQKYNLPKIDGDIGDLIENSIYFQSYNAEKQQEQMQQMSQQSGNEEDNNEEDNNEEDNGDEENNNEDENPFDKYSSEEDNSDEEKGNNDIFAKAFTKYLNKEESNNIIK